MSEVSSGITVNIDGSEAMVVVNDRLGRGFESDYTGTRVEVASRGTPAAIEALLRGEIDLVALGRQLTQEERNQNLVQVTLKRDKIAVIVGPDNPFNGSLTLNQFAQIFRGEITDWSELGGEPGPIRFVDRPTDSDVRLAFREYQPFTTVPFSSGDNAVVVETDETHAVIAELGRDGIGYAPAQHVIGLDTVKVLRMHNTLPTNPAYPYSQARAYAYQNPPSEATAAFLGYGLAEPGQIAVIAAQQAEADAIASGRPISSAVPQPIVPPSPQLPEGDNVTNQSSPLDGDNSDGTVDPDSDVDGAQAELPPLTGEGESGDVTPSPDLNAPDSDGIDTLDNPDSNTTDSSDNSDSNTTDSSGISGSNSTDRSEGSNSTDTSSIPDADETDPNPTPSTNSFPLWLWWLLPAGLLALALVLVGRDRTARGPTVSAEVSPDPSERPSTSEEETHQPILVTQVETPTDALARLEEATQQNPDDANLWVLQGHALAQLQRYDEAIASYDRALSLEPSTVAALTGKGQICLATVQPHEAIAHLNEAAQLSPDDPLIWLFQGYSFTALQQPKDALEAYDQSIALEASNPNAIVSKGTTLLTLEQSEEAIVCFNQIIDEEITASDFLHRQSQTLGFALQAPNTLMANALNGKGNALMNLGYTGAALSNFQQAVDTDPQNTELWISRGHALLTAQQQEEAIASFEQALALTPNNPAALAGKATAMATA
ncbi:MAG: tetratricopeptide repeat protein [Symploca sp. SIO2B6]|nr:tetratricopeptide repeat protein [Symploca sp. SIO2B6]